MSFSGTQNLDYGALRLGPPDGSARTFLPPERPAPAGPGLLSVPSRRVLRGNPGHDTLRSLGEGAWRWTAAELGTGRAPYPRKRWVPRAHSSGCPGSDPGSVGPPLVLSGQCPGISARRIGPCFENWNRRRPRHVPGQRVTKHDTGPAARSEQVPTDLATRRRHRDRA